LAKRVIGFMRRQQDEKEQTEEEASKKKKATKDMVARWSDGGQGCSKYVQTWRN
jgi:hypothetical protein